MWWGRIGMKVALSEAIAPAGCRKRPTAVNTPATAYSDAQAHVIAATAAACGLLQDTLFLFCTVMLCKQPLLPPELLL
jgi:hypothetical protein